MPDDRVESLAKAIWCRGGSNCDHDWKYVYDGSKRMWREYARAALAHLDKETLDDLADLQRDLLQCDGENRELKARSDEARAILNGVKKVSAYAQEDLVLTAYVSKALWELNRDATNWLEKHEEQGKKSR